MAAWSWMASARAAIRGAMRERQPQEHDYTRRMWGHDFFVNDVIDGGQTIKAGGWGHGIEAGDYLILPNRDGTTRYQVESIRYCGDPSDMWFATLRFAPRAGRAR